MDNFSQPTASEPTVSQPTVSQTSVSQASVPEPTATITLELYRILKDLADDPHPGREFRAFEKYYYRLTKLPFVPSKRTRCTCAIIPSECFYFDSHRHEHYLILGNQAIYGGEFSSHEQAREGLYKRLINRVIASELRKTKTDNTRLLSSDTRPAEEDCS